MAETARRRSPERERGRYRAPALEKGLDILELLAERPEGLSQSEIARALDRSVGEIFRMLNCLVERGYLAIQRPSDRYILTLKLFELAHRHAPIDRLLGNALPLMKELASQVHQSCHLALIEGGHGVVVAQVDSPGHIGFAVRVGSVISLPWTASGRTLLAFQSDEDRTRILARAGPDGEIGDPASLRRELDLVRARGYEEMDSTRIRGVHDVSFPVLDHRGSALAAITVPFIERLDLPAFGSLAQAREALLRCASRLTSSLGGRNPLSAGAVAGFAAQGR
jgi:DNA-binding IclR family transcriptional regulator